MDRLVGNERARLWLRRLIDSGAVGQTLLFSGPQGVGKRQFALALGEELVCVDEGAQRRWRAGHHPDLHLYSPSGKAELHSIESMRDFKRELAMRPNESERSLFLIDDAERMLPTSANALLKSFEEPPGHALVILIASDRESILPTIRSRCRTLPFAPISRESLVEFLLARSKGLTKESAFRLAVEARGSAGRACELLEKGEDGMRQALLSALSRGEIPGDYCAIHRLAEEFSGERGVLEELLGWYRDLHLLRSGGGELFHPDWEAKLRGQSDPPPLEDVERKVRIASAALDRGGKPSAVFETLLMQLH